jgi:hypothetical protein
MSKISLETLLYYIILAEKMFKAGTGEHKKKFVIKSLSKVLGGIIPDSIPEDQKEEVLGFLIDMACFIMFKYLKRFKVTMESQQTEELNKDDSNPSEG